MKHIILLLILAGLWFSPARAQQGYPASYAGAPRFRALIVWSPHVEEAHVQFSRDAIRFFHKLSYGEGFLMDTTPHFNQFADSLERYNIIVMLTTQPHG